MKGYTDFIGGMLEYHPAHNDGMRYMDWEKVKQICLLNPKAEIRAGLREDWNNTSGLIFKNGKYYDGYVYGSSYWATPIIDVNGEEIEVYTNIDNGFTGKPDWWGEGTELKDPWDEDDDIFVF